MGILEIKKAPKNPKKYECTICDYQCSNKKDFTRHLTTSKHAKRENGNEWKCLEIKKPHSITHTIQCDCGKIFVTNAGLWKHKKKCDGVQHDGMVSPSPVEHKSDTIKEMKDMIFTLVTQNKDMQTLIVEQNRTIVELTKNNQTTNNTIHNTHTNSHNKTFNLNLFLNETCKDAMNITDFVKSLNLNLSDLEKVGELGYAEGITRVFVKGLNDLDITKRPIHCSDLKREILHIKDQDKWERDTTNQDRLKNAIKELSNKNIMLLDDWQRENPGCTEYDNRKNDLYLRMVVESMGPTDETSAKKDFGKIIRTIARNTIINKEPDAAF